MTDERMRSASEQILRDPAVRRLRSALVQTSLPFVHLVGGALRDRLLGFDTTDFDFVVRGEARVAAERLAGLLGARFLLLDEDWGVARLVWSPPGEEQGPLRLDFASMRGQTIQEDLLLRDFTCNALAMPIHPDDNALSRVWEDPTGGLKDIRAGRLRAIHPERLREDPLRLLRAFRLACNLELRIEENTFRWIRTAREGIHTVAAERTRDEWFKILACARSFDSILQMDGAGLLTTLFPALEGLKGLRQGGYHHLDAWDHTLEAYRTLEEDSRTGFRRIAPWDAELRTWLASGKETLPLLKAAVLFHDIGKPGALSVDAEGEVHFYGHADKGADLSAGAMRRLRTRRRDEERIRKWVRFHMGPVHMMRAMEGGRLTEKAKIRFLRRLGTDAPGMLLLTLADFSATGGPSSTEDRNEAFQRLLDSLFELYFRRDAASIAGKRLVTGKDLIDALGIPPGPAVGRLLRLLEEARVEGKITDRAGAIRLARSLIEETRQQRNGT